MVATVGVRVVEAGFLLAFLAGLWLVWTQTRRGLILGVYFGAFLSWQHDWVYAGPEMWNMEFQSDSIWIATWGGRGEALWAPLSYGAFFGILTLVWLKYLEEPLRDRLGVWRYGVAMVGVYVANVIVEGVMIELTEANVYGLDDKWLFFNIPWLHFVTTGLMLVVTLFMISQARHILDQLGWDDLDVADGDREHPPRTRTAILLIGVALPHAAFATAMMVGLYVYQLLGVHT